MNRESSCSVRRPVIKVGSAVIADGGRLQLGVIARLVDEVAELRLANLEPVLVVSGAVAAGYRAMGATSPPVRVVERQTAASIGQPRLLSIFSRFFQEHGLSVAQLLLTAEDVENRRRFVSARHTLSTLLQNGVVPIINENDALSDDESKVGDNDHLAALVTSLVSADLLVLFSRVPGVLKERGKGPVLERVEPDEDVSVHVSSERSESGVGGMGAKISAARLATDWGVPTVIASGREPGLLSRIVAGDPHGTFFVPRPSRIASRKRWIAVRSRSLGALVVDDGAKKAIIQNGASLLPSGLVEVRELFSMGARVDICGLDGGVVAVGLTSYGSEEIRRMQGRQASEFKEVLGYEYISAIVHREDLVVL